MRLDSRHWRRWRRWRRWPHRRRRRRPRWCREKRRPRKLGAAVDAISAQQAVAVLATIRADSVRVEVADLKREADQNQIAGARPHWKKRVFEFRSAVAVGCSQQRVPAVPVRRRIRTSARRSNLAPGDTLGIASQLCYLTLHPPNSCFSLTRRACVLCYGLAPEGLRFVFWQVCTR